MQQKLKAMKTPNSINFPNQSSRRLITIVCAVALLVPAYSMAYAQDQTLATAAASETAPPIPAEKLDSLVAPIALYPDPLLAHAPPKTSPVPNARPIPA